jgi:O-antigen ligase
VCTSLSNGPVLALAAAAFVFVSRMDWRMAMALVCFAVAAVVTLSAYSGEPYADVVTDFLLSPGSAQYRIALVREALGGGMNEHWWTGYGYVGHGPGNDNAHFHWYHTDLVNMYIEILVRTGLLGLIPFLLAIAGCYVRVVQALRLAPTTDAAWIAWCVLAALVGWNVAMMTVGTLDQILQLLYILIAIASNMPIIVEVEAAQWEQKNER